MVWSVPRILVPLMIFRRLRLDHLGDATAFYYLHEELLGLLRRNESPAARGARTEAICRQPRARLTRVRQRGPAIKRLTVLVLRFP
jgi:hypothetical protein